MINGTWMHDHGCLTGPSKTLCVHLVEFHIFFSGRNKGIGSPFGLNSQQDKGILMREYIIEIRGELSPRPDTLEFFGQ
jgi:hypothetical protein